MKREITYESVLELMERQSILFNQNLENSRKEFNESLINNRKEFNESLNRSRKEFDKKLGELTGTWGKFVAEMVKPKIVELFQEKGIQIETTVQFVEGIKNGQKFYEIDLLLINTDIAVVVEIKSALSIEDIDEHLERLDKIKKVSPKRIDLSGVTIYGAVAGMIVEQGADRYAYKKGLYVLRQRGNLVEIVNDEKFKPAAWRVEY